MRVVTGAAPSSRPLLTAEDLLAGGMKYDHCELWDGTLLVHDPSGGWPSGGWPSGGWAGNVAAEVAARLWRHVEGRKSGWVFTAEQGFVVARSPDRLLAPDVAYVSRARLPRVPQVAFVEGAPDFCVEVRSPSDSWTAVVEKCGRWIAHGVRVAWAIDPTQRRVHVVRPDVSPVEGGPGDVVHAAPVLPDFRVAVDELFAGLG